MKLELFSVAAYISDKDSCLSYYNIAVLQEPQYVNSFENFIEDMSKVQTDLEIGRVCDTSAIDGVVHFFPKGNA